MSRGIDSRQAAAGLRYLLSHITEIILPSPPGPRKRTFILFVAAGSRELEAANFEPLLANGWTGIAGAIPLLISLFLGIEAATEVGEEVRGGGKTIARGIAIAVTVSALTYFGVSFVALGVLGADGLAASSAPLLDSADRFLGAW